MAGCAGRRPSAAATQAAELTALLQTYHELALDNRFDRVAGGATDRPAVRADHAALLRDCLRFEDRAREVRAADDQRLAGQYVWLLARVLVDDAANALLLDDLGGSQDRRGLDQAEEQARQRIARRTQRLSPDKTRCEQVQLAGLARGTAAVGR